MELQEYISNEIVRRREEIGMSRYKLEKLTGIDYNNLMKAEKGEKSLTTKTIEKILDALGLEIVIKPKNRIENV